MASEFQEALTAAGVDNVVLHEGPLGEGAHQHGPYDVIIVQGGVGELPSTLEAQLKEDGRIACLFVDGSLGEVRIGRKTQGRIAWRAAFNAGALLPCAQSLTASPNAENRIFDTGSFAAFHSGCHCTDRVNPGAPST